MRERSPGRWELIVEGPRDPVTGRRRQVTRAFRGSLREAKAARAELLTEVKRGRHTGTSGTVDDLFAEWIVELRRKGRAANTVRSYENMYRRNIQPTLGRRSVRSITTKMLTDLYGAHQDRGMKPSTVRKIHATVSSMMTQACRWGWIGVNPAQWAEPPQLPIAAPVVPTPVELDQLIQAAATSRRPEYARLLFLAATTGMRRGELLALRRTDIDMERQLLTVSRSLTDLSHEGVTEGPTKNRQIRRVALDSRSLGIITDQLAMMAGRTEGLSVDLDTDCFLFSDALDGSEPWRPMMVTRYFGRLRSRLGLDHLSFKSLRRFMDTYGQDLGFAPAQVALRAGHDPSVAGRFYTGNVAEADRQLAEAVSGLLSIPEMLG
jgi:integrase